LEFISVEKPYTTTIEVPIDGIPPEIMIVISAAVNEAIAAQLHPELVSVISAAATVTVHPMKVRVTKVRKTGVTRIRYRKKAPDLTWAIQGRVSIMVSHQMLGIRQNRII